LNKGQKMMAKALLVMVLWGALFPLVKLGFRTYSVITTGDILLFHVQSLKTGRNNNKFSESRNPISSKNACIFKK